MNKPFILTPEQQKFAEEMSNLVFSFLNERRLDENEYYDVVVFGFLKAVNRYFEQERLRKYAFSTIAYRQMRSTLSNYYKAIQNKKKYFDTVSLDTLCFDSIEAPEDSLMDNFENELLLHSLSAVASKRQMQIIHLLLHGCGKKEIAGKTRLTMNEVQRIIDSLRPIVISVVRE